MNKCNNYRYLEGAASASEGNETKTANKAKTTAADVIKRFIIAPGSG